MTGRDLLKLPETGWLWPLYIPRGHLTVVVGQPGSGKSTFVQDLTRRLSLGRKWPDDSPITEKGKTLWIDAEGAKSIISDRLKKWEMNPDDFIIPRQADIYADFTLTPEASTQIKAILELHKPKLVVLDCLTGVHAREEKSAQGMKPVMDEFKEWAALFNCAVIIVHHINKENPAFRAPKITLDRIRGTSHIAASVRSACAVDKTQSYNSQHSNNEQIHRVYQIKNNLAQVIEEPLYFTISDKGVSYIKQPDGIGFDACSSQSQLIKPKS